MRPETMRLIDECPTVIGMMTTAVGSGGSLDSAIRTVASEGPQRSREMFSRAVRKADTKGSRSLTEALSDEVSGLPPEASGYRNSVMLCIAASESTSSEEGLMLLREASDVALGSVRAMGERYSSSLTVPCMTVFGIGIMVPMILMSILPLLGVGGLFGGFGIDSGVVTTVTLVVIPSAILLISFWIRRGNPFSSNDGGPGGLRCAVPLLSAVPLALLALSSGCTVETTVFLSIAPAALVSAMLMVSDRRAMSARRECELGLRNCIFELGNRMMGGESFERVCVETVSGRRECSEVGMRLGREMEICRGDTESAVRRTITPVSPEVSRALCDILRCSSRDTEDAGRLAMALGRQFHNSDDVRRRLESELRSMMDMMTGTAVLFAPMVLGMSIAMLGPLSEVSGYQGAGDTGAILSVYLVELCGLIAVLTSDLKGRSGTREVVWRFVTMIPVALVVFRICSGIGL